MGPWSESPARFSRSKYGETDLDKLIDYLDLEIEIFANRKQKTAPQWDRSCIDNIEIFFTWFYSRSPNSRNGT